MRIHTFTLYVCILFESRQGKYLYYLSSLQYLVNSKVSATQLCGQCAVSMSDNCSADKLGVNVNKEKIQ